MSTCSDDDDEGEREAREADAEADAETEVEDEDEDEEVRLLLPKHFLKAMITFAEATLLAKRGRAGHPVLSEANHVSHAAKSILTVYAQFFQMPSDKQRKETAMVKKLMSAIKLMRHHPGDCWKPVKASPGGAAARPGCGCLTGGYPFVKELGAQLDERQLATLLLAFARLALLRCVLKAAHWQGCPCRPLAALPRGLVNVADSTTSATPRRQAATPGARKQAGLRRGACDGARAGGLADGVRACRGEAAEAGSPGS